MVGDRNKELANEVVVLRALLWTSGLAWDIALPTPDDTDLIGVKASKEECHCTTGVERTSGNFLWTHSSMARDAGDHGRGDCRLSACLIIVDMQRSVG